MIEDFMNDDPDLLFFLVLVIATIVIAIVVGLGWLFIYLIGLMI